MTRTAASLGVDFQELHRVEEVSVRRHGAYLGRLLRTSAGGPVWADRALQGHIGGALTVDGTMAEARKAVLARIADGEETK